MELFFCSYFLVLGISTYAKYFLFLCLGILLSQYLIDYETIIFISLLVYSTGLKLKKSSQFLIPILISIGLISNHLDSIKKNVKINPQYLLITNSYSNYSHEARSISTNEKFLIKSTNHKSGQIIHSKSAPKKLINHRNPEVFEFNKYLKQKNISAYIEFSDTVNSVNIKLSLMDFIQLSIPQKAYSKFDLFIKKSYWSKAILFGNKKGLSKELKQQFNHLGVWHLFAISGMHIALIYLLLEFIMSPLNYSKHVKNMSPYILIIGLWGFCSLCAFTPSAVRATVMLSFYSIGKTFRKDLSTLNLLFFSGFIMLIVNPKDLFSISFQFSFLAVWALLCIPQYIFPKLNSKYKIIQLILNSFRISVSIQFLLIPIQLYYFNTLPLGSIFANLILTPIVTFELYINCLILLSPINALNNLLGTIADFGYNLIESIATWKLWSKIFLSSIYPNLTFTILTTSLIMILHFLQKLKFISLLVLGALFISTTFIPRYPTRDLIVFNFPPHICIESRNRSKTIQYVSKQLPEYVNKSILGSLNKRGVTIDSLVEIQHYKQPDWFIHQIDTFQIIDKKIWWYPVFKQKAILYIRNNSYLDKNNLILSKPQLIISDKTCSDKYRTFLSILCEKNEIEFWDITKKGAYTSPIPN